MFRHYLVILRQLLINTLPSHTSISNAAVGNTIYNLKLFHIFYADGILMFKILFYFPVWFYFHEVLATGICINNILETSAYFAEKPHTSTHHPMNVSW